MMFAGLAQAAPQPEQSVPCLRLSRIQDVEILDNSRILFRTGVNDYYLNTLPHACSGLKLHDAFQHRTSVDEICEVDVITVVDQIGSRVYTGPVCGLGKFEPISKEEITAIRQTL
jgi:hypothetical protein